jgi:ribonuclease BN (tRNA processing enzyme)
MRLHVLGSAIVSTTVRNHEIPVPATGYLLESGSAFLLIDCGPGVVAALGGLLPLRDLTGVIVSHVHFDNFYDIPLLAFGLYADKFDPFIRNQKPVGAPIPVALPPEGTGYMRELVAIAMRPHGSYRQIMGGRLVPHDYMPGEPWTTGPFTVTPVGPVAHGPGPCFGFRVTDGVTTLGYSGDSGLCDAQFAIAHDVDLYLCDAMMATDQIMSFQSQRHLSAENAGRIADRAGAKHLVLTHLLNPAPEWCDQLQKAARGTCHVPVSIAHVGAVFDIPFR